MAYGPNGPSLPATPEEWTAPQWINYVCHQDAPWLAERMRQRVQDFAKVLACRFPTVQDYSTPAWRKSLLRGLASWRYATRRGAEVGAVEGAAEGEFIVAHGQGGAMSYVAWTRREPCFTCMDKAGAMSYLVRNSIR